MINQAREVASGGSPPPDIWQQEFLMDCSDDIGEQAPKAPWIPL